MKGYPKNLNTKEDYEYVRTHFPKEQWEQDWQNLLDTEYDWVPVKEMNEEEAANLQLDATHKIVYEDDEGGKAAYVEFELQLIPSCKLTRLGLTEDYVRQVLEND